MTAALGNGSAPRPSLRQPRPRAPRFILDSTSSPLEATRQPSSGPTKAADLRPIPLTGAYAGRHHSASPKAVEAWSARGWTVCDMVFRCPCAPLPPAPRLHHACVRVHVHACAVRAPARVRAHALAPCRTTHELTRVRAPVTLRVRQTPRISARRR